MVVDEVQNEFPHERTSCLIELICTGIVSGRPRVAENSFLSRVASLVAGPRAALLLAPRYGRPVVGIRQFDRDVPRRADHAITAVGVVATFEGFQHEKEFFSEHWRIPLRVVWMLV
jgi:hypothetical protein